MQKDLCRFITQVFFKFIYAAFLIKSKQGHFLHRLFSPFLNFLQHFFLIFLGISIPSCSSFFLCFFLFPHNLCG